MRLISISSSSDDVITKNLHDYMDVQIFAKIFVGSNQQPFQMIFDTGSNWLWVFSRMCGNCNQPKFDERQSESHTFYNVVYDIHYGSGDVYGYNSHDKVCITSTDCADDYSFLNIGMHSNLYSLKASGIVGMSPTDANENGHLFIVKMKRSGVISKA